MTEPTLSLPPGADDPNVRWSAAEFAAAGCSFELFAPPPRARWRYTLTELAARGIPGVGRKLKDVRKKAHDEGWDEAIDSSGEPLASCRDTGEIEYDPLVLPLVSQAHIAAREGGDALEVAVARRRDDGEWEYHWTVFPALAAKVLCVRRARGEIAS